MRAILRYPLAIPFPGKKNRPGSRSGSWRSHSQNCSDLQQISPATLPTLDNNGATPEVKVQD